MAELTLQQIFGAGATQTATDIIIKKADLTPKGLTASATNKGEVLFVAIVLKAKDALTTSTLETNADQSISIEQGYSSLVSRNSINYRQDSFTINLQKLDTATTIDPDNY